MQARPIATSLKVELTLFLLSLRGALATWQSRPNKFLCQRPGTLDRQGLRPRGDGFSLVELSIVLVILGLLTGGILAGQSLIRAAELRAVSTEYSRYAAATNSFRDKYFALPGDMTNATQFWGFAGTAAAPGCLSNSGITGVSATGTCDGNGDGQITYTSFVANGTSEGYAFWQQLALAGLIEGQYTGRYNATIAPYITLGVNVAKSKLSNAGWAEFSFPTVAINGGGWANFEGNYGNTLVFGSVSNALTEGPAIKAEEAWNIDTKMDDGKPGTGQIRAYETYTNCQDAGTSTTVALAGTANYKLTDTSISCSLLFDLK